MSLIPDFEIGLWNAWILMLYAMLHPLIMMLIDKAVGTGDMSKKMEYPALSKAEQVGFILANVVLFIGLFIYSIFLPLKLGTAWFYTGLVLCLLGVVVWTTAIVNIADIPLGKPFTKGLYPLFETPHGHGFVFNITWCGHSFSFMAFFIAFGCAHSFVTYPHKD